MEKNKAAQELNRRRNEKYGPEWRKATATKAGIASGKKRKKTKKRASR